MTSTRLVAGLAVASALAACIPFPYGPYWRPEAEGGRYSRAWCGGMEGPYTTVDLTLAPGVEVRARVVDGKERQSIFAVFNVQGEPVRFGPTVRLESRAGSQTLAANLGYTVVEGGKARRVDVGGVVAPKDGKPGTASLELELPPSIDAFTVWLPEGQRGTSNIVPVPIRFERRTVDGGFQAFNC